jgi:enoyl-CoA hydratase
MSVTLSSQDRVALVQIDRPPVNAIDHGVIDEMQAAVERVADDVDARALVITGNDRGFSAGADIAVMADLSEENQRRMRRSVDVQHALESLEKPVVAAIRGYALGGGAELALACDFRIMAPDSTLGFPEVDLGLFPGAGGTQRLARLLGPHQAFRLMVEGRRLTGAEALDPGLADELVGTRAEVLDRATELAADLARRPTRTIGLLKRCVHDGWGRPLQDGLAVEEAAVLEVIKTQDAREGITAFLEKRRPEFHGR